jgi:hypothetical protein
MILHALKEVVTYVVDEIARTASEAGIELCFSTPVAAATMAVTRRQYLCSCGESRQRWSDGIATSTSGRRSIERQRRRHAARQSFTTRSSAIAGATLSLSSSSIYRCIGVARFLLVMSIYSLRGSVCGIGRRARLQQMLNLREWLIFGLQVKPRGGRWLLIDDVCFVALAPWQSTFYKRPPHVTRRAEAEAAGDGEAVHLDEQHDALVRAGTWSKIALYAVALSRLRY